MADEKDEALQELYDAIPRGWIVGRPPQDPRDKRWRLYCYDRRRRQGPLAAVVAEAESEEAVVREMARKLRSASSK